MAMTKFIQDSYLDRGKPCSPCLGFEQVNDVKGCQNNSISPELSSPMQKTSHDLRKFSYRPLTE